MATELQREAAKPNSAVQAQNDGLATPAALARPTELENGLQSKERLIDVDLAHARLSHILPTEFIVQAE
jgi:MoxR-like ATPase